MSQDFFLKFSFQPSFFGAWVLIGLVYQLSCILNQMSLLNILQAGLDLKPCSHKFNCCSMDLAPSWPKEKPWVRAGQLGSSSLTGTATGNQSHLTNSWDVSLLLRDFLFFCSELVLSNTGLKIHDSFQKKKINLLVREVYWQIWTIIHFLHQPLLSHVVSWTRETRRVATGHRFN